MIKLITLPKAYGSSVFCDDIRLEAGNKVSFMGVYTNGITLHSTFPAVLPKFCIWVSYSERPNLVAPTESLRIKVFLPGQDDEDGPAAVEHEVNVQQHRAVPMPTGAPTGLYAEWIRFTNIPLVFAPLTIQQTGFIKVRAFLGHDEMVKLGALKVDQLIPQEVVAMTEQGGKEK